MINLTKERSGAEGSAAKRRQKGKTVRGSGFTYTEDQKRTDQSVPLETADKQEIVKLPNLGQKNRP